MRQSAGRFAPSPTGPLHYGSLLAATASFLDARSLGQQWLLRIDDLDTHRNLPGAEAAITTSLERHGLLWDGPVLHQRERIERYEAALASLVERGLIYYCSCSRRQLKDHDRYPGTCRTRTTPRPDTSIRLNVDAAVVRFVDLIAGHQREALAESCGDFIIRRRDGLIAYQLATAVDDGDEQISRVVRGGDLLDNTARQIHLMTLLDLTRPTYAHLPVLTDAAGAKLSKQTNAAPVDDSRPTANLLLIYPFLGLSPPSDAARWPPGELLSWGIENWSIEAISAGNRPFRH
jgi:glutamyl-Q tRNA(Asp) synthetase